MTGITTYKVQKQVIQSLWFLCSAHHIMVIYICIKFQESISNSFQVPEWMTYIKEITIFNVQRAITPKVG